MIFIILTIFILINLLSNHTYKNGTIKNITIKNGIID
jgi:hypothetical protein